MEKVTELRQEIAVGAVGPPDEQAVDRAVEGLKQMPLLGKDLSDAFDQRTEETEGPQFVVVRSRANPLKKVGSWFRWSR